ncbi:MAG TPA: hypothetical protein VK774_04345, partial [Solirubrobacteraceae bacterium]|nr:hypothetical protein [Solirubrobacteraceae bacterium]
YWHGIDGLDSLRGDVHVVGDGDGALTEVLMMLIDRFGHAVVERLCEMLPTKHLDKLDEADLRAQGHPSAEANPCRADAESSLIKAIFELLSDRRSVFIHASNPLGGKSFLLNRVLVSHLVWSPSPMVTLHPGPRIQESEASSLGGNVIWRAGVRADPPRWARARMTSANSIERKPDGADEEAGDQTPPEEQALLNGLRIGLLDGLRRPAWTPLAEGRVRSAVGSPSGWIEPAVESLTAVDGLPTKSAEELLQVLAATRAALERLGVEKLSVIRHRGTEWVSIDVLARAGSLPHSNLVEPLSRTEARQRRLRAQAKHVPVRLTATLCRDEHERLWFGLPSDAKGAKPTRSAVCALVGPDGVVEWARGRRAARNRGERRDIRRSETRDDESVLRGLSDVANTDAQTQLRLAALHEQRGEWDLARGAYLRAARRPGGKRQPGQESIVMNEMFRRVLLRLAGATARLLPRERDAAADAIWLLLSVAAADLVTLVDREELMLELHTTPTFLIREWAPRVRSVLTVPGTRKVTLDHAPLPGWAMPLADAGMRLPPSPSQRHIRGRIERGATNGELDTIRELATDAARQIYTETRDNALITLSELGVWPAGAPRDAELRSDGAAT